MNSSAKTALIVGSVVVALLVGVPLVWGTVAGSPASGWGMMGPGMMGGGAWMGFGAVFMVLFWGLIIWAVVASAQGLSHGRSSDDGWEPESALEVLKRRYARSEISKDEYDEKKRDLA